MLDILGLDLITNSEEAEAEKDVEESECGYRASDRAKYRMGFIILQGKLKGSEIPYCEAKCG